MAELQTLTKIPEDEVDRIQVRRTPTKVAEDETDRTRVRKTPTRKLTFSLGFRSSKSPSPRVPSESETATVSHHRHVDWKRFKRDRVSEVLEKSQGLDEVLRSLYISGSHLWKVRSPTKWYRRRFNLDLGEMVLKYDPSYKAGCIPGRKKNVEMSDIVDVRKGWKTDTFNKVGAEQDRRSKLKDYKRNVDEKNCFSIIHGLKRDTLDLVAPNSDVADKWVRCLEYLISWHTSREQEKSYENWLRKKFMSADLDGNRCLCFKETIKLLEDLNIHMPEMEAMRLFNEANVKRSSTGEDEVLDEDEFILFYFELIKRQEIETLFNSYSKTKGILKANELCQFLQKEQGEYANVSVEECEDIISTYEQSDMKKRGQMSIAGFLNMMLSAKFDIFKEEQKIIYQDMDQPLSHYYIASSHNTYLLGNQLSGTSSVEGYIDALKKGCRCVELDLWDGDNGEPMITHGFTLTTKIYLKEVLDDAIKPYAFVASKYPLILSLENHCTPPFQQRAAYLLREILGDMLYVEDVDEDLKFLPSPNQLQYKILVKGKKSSPKGDHQSKKPKSAFYADISKDGTDSIGKSKSSLKSKSSTTEPTYESGESDSESSGERGTDSVDAKEKKTIITDDLSALVNLVKAVHFTSFYESKMRGKYYEMSSFSEAKAAKFADTEGQDFINYNKRQLSRIYPAGSRTSSSNFDPIRFWNVGCQIVALNYQTEDVANYMNHARFAENGGCGYVLKPDFLRDPNINFDPLGTLDKKKSVRLRIRIISGQHLPKAPGNPEIVDPYIEIKISGLPQDKAMFTTRSIHNNGFNPVWDEVFEVRVRCPELAIMYLRVKDYAHSGTDMPLAHFAIPVTAISPGYGHIQLQDLKGVSLQPSTLFVQVNVTPYSDP